MRKLIRSLFLVADVVIVSSIVLAVVTIVGSFSTMLSISFGTELPHAIAGGSILGSWMLFLGGTLLTAIGLFGYVLLMRRQVLGLIPVFLVSFVGIFVFAEQTKFYLIAIGVKLTILALPWLLTYVDLKRRKVLAAP